MTTSFDQATERRAHDLIAAAFDNVPSHTLSPDRIAQELDRQTTDLPQRKRFRVPAGGLRHDGLVRIGTWNLEGRWSRDHLDLLIQQNCDVWLLTEVRTDAVLTGFNSHLSASRMAEGKHWAGVFSRSSLQPLLDPHPASVAAFTADWCFCSSILPWRSCGSTPWGQGTNGEKTQRAINQLMGHDAYPTQVTAP